MKAGKIINKDGIRYVTTRTGKHLAVFEFRKYDRVDNPEAEKAIVSTWDQYKNPVGYVSFRQIHDTTNLPYPLIFGVLKDIFTRHPYSVIFNVERMGQNVYFKLINYPNVRID